MDIYILREGQQTGPFTLEATQALLQQGDVAAGDFAWQPGMEKWVPLSDLLAVSTGEPPAEPEKRLAESAEPATEKQKALLSYLDVIVPPRLSQDQAAQLVNQALEDPKHAERLAQWEQDRLRLHAHLFATEIQVEKENRANHFFELCQTGGAEYFTGITKAHCQVLVGFLDVKFPNWDARGTAAADHYFFPAVAEKFPQLVQKQWRGRLHYTEGPKVAPELTRKSPTTKLGKPSASPVAAILRGLLLGGLILGVLYAVHRVVQDATQRAVVLPQPVARAAGAVPPLATAQTAPPSNTHLRTDLPPPNTPATASSPVTQTEPIPTPAAASAPLTAVPPSSAPPIAPTDPAMTTAPMAAVPVSPTVSPDPAMSPIAVNAAPMAINTAPMAVLPGAEPPVPIPPPPATLPTASTTPLGAPATITPVLPDPTTATRTSLVLTKPVEIQLAYGKMKLPVGTPVKLIARQGGQLRVSYQNSVITIPAASTDLE
jgi:hypothetical protein